VGFLAGACPALPFKPLPEPLSELVPGRGLNEGVTEEPIQQEIFRYAARARGIRFG
jgi:hypothetical protein